MTQSHNEEQNEIISEKKEQPDILGVLKDIQQRLVFLERKIDNLGIQSTERKPFQDRPFQRHNRPFNRFNRSDKRPDRGGAPSEGRFSSEGERPRRFGKPHAGGVGGQGLGEGRKKKFFHRGKG